MTKAGMAAAYIGKAERALETAGWLLARSDTEGACNRAYYAMFYAAHTVLWAVGAQEPGTIIKTHGGLVASFGQKLVLARLVDAEHGRELAQVQNTRLLADYTAEPPTCDDAREAVGLARSFVAAMRAALERREP